MNRKLSYLFLSMVGVLILASPTCEEGIPTEEEIEKKQENLQSAREDLETPAPTRKNLIGLFMEGTTPESATPPDIQVDGFAKLVFMIDSVTIVNPLEKENGINYQGRIRYRFHTLGIHAADTILLRSSVEEMGMVLQKRSKEFGEKRLQFWEVQLTI